MLKLKHGILELTLSAIAIIVTASILLKAIIDIDPNYDVWWYHLPFAARIWDIVPRETFIGDEKWFEPRFDGFPLLAHFLQGFLWRITGRIQSTNLVNFLSIFSYFFFLKIYFQVPFYLAAIALWAIPLVTTHTSTSFVDLFGNVGTSILVMMTYRFYLNQQLPQKKELFIACLGAAIAVNTKTQLQPLVFSILIFTGLRLAWLYWREKSSVIKFLKMLPTVLLATIIIFASPVKNTILYRNPVYPIKVEVAGIVLNHKLTPEAYESGNRQKNWLESVLEINSTLHWTADQWSPDASRIHRGGFFGAYVIFNILLLLSLSIYEFRHHQKSTSAVGSQDARTALVTVLVMSIVPANFPQSHELRYFMFWMICLVSLNLSLLSRSHKLLCRPQYLDGICRTKFGIPLDRSKLNNTTDSWDEPNRLHPVSVEQTNQKTRRWLHPRYMGLVYLVFLTIVLSKTGNFYGRPVFNSLEQRLASGVKPELLNQIEPNGKVCLIIKPGLANRKKVPLESQENAFLYSSYFHPELDYDYSVRAALNPESCGDRTIIPNSATKK